ncbi:MAG: hypothetical protein IJS78_07475 [Clostridia bacterium]|nr:hypothetical protein [Clostridia bacterium]
MERLFTIPVNEAFENAAGDAGGCPFCALVEKLTNDEVDLILGASMMEPDVRIKTNEAGFCDRHFPMLFEGGKRLPLALMLESHVARVRERMKPSGLASLVPSKAGAASAKTVSEIAKSCYLCDRIEYNLSRMIETAALLWESESAFREKTEAVPFFCLPHYARFLDAAKERLSGREFGEFFSALSKKEDGYIASLGDDVSAFCRSFDYRQGGEPLTDAEKRAPERARDFLAGKPVEQAKK